MRVHAAFLAVLALSATLGLVMAQDRPAREPALAPRRRPDHGVAGEGARRPGHHRPARLVRQGLQREGREGPRRPVHPGRRDRGRGRRGHAGPRRHRRAVRGDLQGERRRQAHRGHRLPAVPRDGYRHRGGHGVALDRAGAPPDTNRYSVIYARQGGRWLHARIRDEPPEDDSPHEQLRELEWMLGEWVNESDDGIVKTTLQVVG